MIKIKTKKNLPETAIAFERGEGLRPDLTDFSPPPKRGRPSKNKNTMETETLPDAAVPLPSSDAESLPHPAKLPEAVRSAITTSDRDERDMEFFLVGFGTGVALCLSVYLMYKIVSK